ncbi:MFS transporter [Paraburkholderia diazotrophica]|uniref:MFS transporter n=1 Tax=Paraburkholderia diazotrophica TaxID=667676 RepID=UPI00316EB74E
MTQKTMLMKRTQRTAVIILTIAGAINFLDRSTLAIANHAVRDELGLSATQMGVLLSAFLFAYSFSQIPMGALIDRLGCRIMIGLGMLLWSLAQFSGGLAGSMEFMLGARIVLGITETPLFPSVPKIICDWFPLRERGRPQGIFQTCSTIGPAIAPPFLTGLMLVFGWRGMFMIMGGAGAVTAAVWYLLYRNRNEVALTREEERYLEEGENPGTGQRAISFAAWRSLAGSRTTIGMTLGFIGVVYMVWLYLTWLPAYVEQRFHLSIAQAGWVLSIPYVFGTIAMFSSGFIVDALARRGMTPINSRKWPICVGLTLASMFTVFVAFADSVVSIVVLLSIAFLFLYVASGACWMLVNVVAPRHIVGSLGSIMAFGAFLGGAFAPLVTGIVVDQTHSFVGAFLSAAVVSTVAAFIYLIVVRTPIAIPERVIGGTPDLVAPH